MQRRRTTGLAVLLCASVLAACGTTVPLAERGGPAPGQDGLSSDPSVPVTGELPVVPGEGVVDGDGGPSVTGPGQPSTVGPGTATAGPGQVAGPRATGLPVSGRGWDAKNVYVGIPTADDFNAVVKNLGANFSNGDIHGDVDAIVADINSSGGLLGRRVVAVYHDASTVELSSNPASVGQSMCSYFTQDRPVVAVLNGSPQLDAQDSFHRCLEGKQTPLLSFSNTDYSDKDYVRLGPHLFTVASLSTDVIVPAFVAALDRQQFFTGWDTTLGAPSKNPAKVGLLLPETAAGHHVGTLFRSSLKRIGVEVASDFFYDPAGTGGKSQAEVLRFSSAGVTHVLDLPPIAAEVYFFQGTAEQQHYRPRYGFTSFNLPLSMQENPTLSPPVQSVGSIGIGWQPLSDVDAERDPGAMPGTKRCTSALSRGGQVFSSSQRRAAFIGAQFCDALYLLRDALAAAGGLTGADLLRGMPLAGPRFLAAGTFGSVLAGTDHGVPGYYRDQAYDAACSCFTYRGPKRAF